MDYFLYVRAALDYIESHLEDGVTCEGIARAAGFSASHFHSVFRAAMGMPLASYVRGRRLVHAARRLAETAEPILDIALRYGFSGHEAFTRAFGRAFGCSPRDFRREGRFVDMGMVIPGLFGPMPLRKEEKTMCKQKEQGKGFAVLHGVPKVSYFTDPPECTPYSACLRACLGYMGEDIPYAHLLCTSGAAFRLMWNTKIWDGGNVDIMVMAADPAEPLRRALKAVGRSMKLVCRDTVYTAFKGPDDVRQGDKQDMIALIRREIDAGRPLIGFGIIGPPEACVITGYREDGEALLGWNFFQDMPEYQGCIEKSEEGYFVRREWYEHPDTVALLAIGEKGKCPDTEILVRDTLAYAAAVMAPRQVWDFAGGLAAFDAWAGKLADESEFPANAPLPMLFERLMCMTDALTMIGEGRYYAHKWTEQMAGQFPGAAGHLLEASGLLKRVCDCAWEMWGWLGGMGMGEKQARSLARRDIREKCIAQIKKARDLDAQAAGHLKQAADML
jgi:AraC-like DNA-binding protein